MSILFLQYPPCSTCQKAKKWLDSHGVSYEARHIKEQNPTAQELKEWHQKSGDVKRLYADFRELSRNVGKPVEYRIEKFL